MGKMTIEDVSRLDFCDLEIAYLFYLHEKAIRMKVTMTLLLGTHNQYKGDLIRNVERTSHDYIHGKH
ncbi:hypothetical protein glysoja_039869 [Glycine soja]|uniref:Uncharacterized protein n=1 Tax=Glycine soja TaxID=3848 RepID=A0A0B2QWC7_GLYSO|nr:hypothetical protein glysoja_039869 [Glycine soja]